MTHTLNVLLLKLKVSTTISEIAGTERQVLDEWHEKIAIAVLNGAQLHFGAVTGYPRFAHTHTRSTVLCFSQRFDDPRSARTSRSRLDLSSHRRKEVMVKNVTGHRLDGPPSQPGRRALTYWVVTPTSVRPAWSDRSV